MVAQGHRRMRSGSRRRLPYAQDGFRAPGSVRRTRGRPRTGVDALQHRACRSLFGGLAAFLIYWVDMWPDMTSMKRSGATMAALILGYKAPDLFVDNKRQKRTDKIRKGLPDALDLLVICAEAGLTVDTAFSRVSKELGRAYPELGEEFALTSIELGFLTERRQAFENLAYRVNLDSVKGVVTTMIQTEKYGTPLASALRVLSAEFRNERMMRAEEKAARLPAIMTVPLILVTCRQMQVELPRHRERIERPFI